MVQNYFILKIRKISLNEIKFPILIKLNSRVETKFFTFSVTTKTVFLCPGFALES